jgi:asparagine synthase (glutamine-hydrolysing)
MSAICGIYHLHTNPSIPQHFSKILDALEKYGPDGASQWHDEHMIMGHQMMCITPESVNEQLPFYDHQCQVCITADARIDNRSELCAKLGTQQTSGLPDSLLILRSYEKWGDNLVEHIIGDFAFVLWDAKQQCLLCVTDPMGLRPLFYAQDSRRQQFIFASEIAAILAMPGLHRQLNEKKLASLGISGLAGILTPDETFFQGINRLPAATLLKISAKGISSREYWRPDPQKKLNFHSDDECREAFQEVFFQATSACMRSAFPVASMLSGGLDSSSIVGAASHLLKQQNKALITLSSVSMPGTQDEAPDERHYTELFNSCANLEMHYVSPARSNGPFDNLEKLVSTGSLSSYIYQHYLMSALIEKAHENKARIILDGNGGEISASSYLEGYLAELLLSGQWKHLSQEIKILAQQHQTSKWRMTKSNILYPLLPYKILKGLGWQRHFDCRARYPLNPAFIQDILGNESLLIHAQLDELMILHPDHRKNLARDIIHYRLDPRHHLEAGYLGYEKAQLAYPYLNKNVLEFCLALPGHFKYSKGTNRRLIRIGSQHLIPEKIQQRASKAPFAPDYLIRYQQGRKKAATQLEEIITGNRSINSIIDFKLMQSILLAQTASAPLPQFSRTDIDSHFIAPWGAYLAVFLSQNLLNS